MKMEAKTFTNPEYPSLLFIFPGTRAMNSRPQKKCQQKEYPLAIKLTFICSKRKGQLVSSLNCTKMAKFLQIYILQVKCRSKRQMGLRNQFPKWRKMNNHYLARRSLRRRQIQKLTERSGLENVRLTTKAAHCIHF